jgi:hypothetical protein
LKADMPKLTPEIITAAIDGFEAQKARIDAQIAELRSFLAGDVAEEVATAPEAPAGKRKKFSAASRRKMAMAQKARWAKIKGESEPTAPAPRVKRKMSAAGKKAIAEAQRKRWAASKEDAKPPAPEAAPKPKRKLSAARKAALVANLAKARATRAAKKAAA